MSDDTTSADDLADLNAILDMPLARLKQNHAPPAEFGVDFGLTDRDLLRVALGVVLAGHDKDPARRDVLLAGLSKANLLIVIGILGALAQRLEPREVTECRARRAAGLLPDDGVTA